MKTMAVKSLVKAVRTFCLCSWITLVGMAGALTAASARKEPTPADALAFFEKSVRPLLAEHCFSCHGAKTQRAGLRFDSRAALLKGGAHGPVLIPGDPAKSLLL